ncbi:MAG: helix-turn-helix transcriptional regulator [Saprospiraceae bacterium]|nr:helix-turn-helix transcriptional regulator [Saprospiraceae bacterium]
MARPKRRDIVCVVELTLNIIGGRWKSMILWHLLEHEILRFGEIKRLVSEGTKEDIKKISKRILSKQLRELEDDGLIIRISHPGKIAKVEYQITEKGQSLKEILLLSYHWGVQEKRRFKSQISI